MSDSAVGEISPAGGQQAGGQWTGEAGAERAVGSAGGQRVVPGRAGSRSASRGTRRPRILVVDDDPDDREIYGRILCYNGFDVVFAADGATALDRAERYPPDLVLLDLCLPDMSGLGVLDSLRERLHLELTPVVALSGLRQHDLGGKVRAAGCARYIEKPASPVAVLHSVEDLIGKAPLPGVGTPPQVIEPPE
jgi:two-component system, cell cycle response regulator DivK